MIITEKMEFLSLAVVAIAFGASLAAQARTDIRGAWTPVAYVLEEGTTRTVDGLLFFSESDWSVLFFIVGDGGPQSGSAEGGRYVLNGDELTFSHQFNMTGGRDLPEASSGNLRITPAAKAKQEKCRIELEGDRLTIFFPSNNSMILKRSSR